MELDRERTQLILLRILGVLLIVVGFTMIARASDSARMPLGISEFADLQHLGRETRCKRNVEVKVRTSGPDRFVYITPPAIPAPPPPPTPPVIQFVH